MMQSHTLPVEQPISGASYSAVELDERRGLVWLLDQRQLPAEEVYLAMNTAEDVAKGIQQMVVRGAPAIGIAAAYGMAVAAKGQTSRDKALERVEGVSKVLREARPTAVNLAWAVDRMLGLLTRLREGTADVFEALLTEARQIHMEDVLACKRMGQLGAALIPDGATILTHCNAGALATGGYGTALGVIRAAHEAGKHVKVLADETRPYWQGARLTAWELHKDGIPVEVIADNMAALFFGTGEVDVVITGADRVARNGDVANKIGTYGLACLAQGHGKPMFVAAPWSTVDLACSSGREIPIEQRDGAELRRVGDRLLVPDGVGVRYPAFDVTPAKMVNALVTERGVIRAPYGPGLRALQAS